ncbi:hypothetical protein F4809DRAFT_644351 [Biscogniauxia mediterranea]|nr:hypothetical protein F4809DRAFT_644351 [Biscogniauxia mediterranea]
MASCPTAASQASARASRARTTILGDAFMQEIVAVFDVAEDVMGFKSAQRTD